MKTDATLKQDVLDELEWEPSINATKIGVAVNNGIVTLNGHVNTYAEKLAAEAAAKRVKGVKAVVQEIDVKILGSFQRTDEDIAQNVLNHLKWDTTVPEENIQIKVENGWITMEGKVNWNFQREAARRVVINLIGVRGVTNLIEVKAAVEPQNVKEKIRKAFERNATIDAGQVKVRIEGHMAILEGNVQSWAEKKQAETAAWSAPGIWEVENKLQIKLQEYA